MTTTFNLLRSPRRKPAAAILPLINVVFLLLMFIVLAGVIRSPDPFTLTPPQATQGEQSDSADPQATIYVSAQGEVRFREAGGEEAALALVTSLARAGDLPAVTLRADAGAPAARIVKLVEALRSTGIARVELQAERRP